MKPEPFNEAFHEHALSLGYQHHHFDADWEETGTGETGPMPSGSPGYDEYLGPDEVVYIGENGEADRADLKEEDCP